MTTPARPDHDATGAEDMARPHFMQCRLPTALYEWLRMSAFQTRRSMTRIVREAVAAYRVEVEAGRIVPGPGRLARARGRPTYSLSLDAETHAWLRTTAFYAHTSLNALLVAALTRASGAQTEVVPGARRPRRDDMATRAPSDDPQGNAEEAATARYIQYHVPPEMYEWVRLQGYLTHGSMTSVVLASISAYRTKVEAGQLALELGRSATIEGMVKCNVRVGGTLFEWVRVTADHAPASMATLVRAALTCAHAAQTDETPRP